MFVAMPYATYSTGVPGAPSLSPLEVAIANDDVAALSQIGPTHLHGPLCDAATSCADDCVAYLLACGADPHAGNPSGLVRAIRAGNARAVRFMLAARPHVLDETITDAAATQPDPWVLADVLDHGAPVDDRHHGLRPIETAASRGLWNHVALLRERGARLDEDLQWI